MLLALACLAGLGSTSSGLQGTGASDQGPLVQAAEESREGRSRGLTNDPDVLSTFVDPRDGRGYRIVRIGNLEWFAENLNHALPGSWCYDDREDHCRRLGRLYNWEAAMAASPPDWRLPTDEDWRNLERAVGMSEDEVGRAYGPRGTVAGKRLKVGGDSGFDALLAGHRGPTGSYSYLDASGDFWSATEHDVGRAVTRQVIDGSDGVVRNTCRKSLGLSVRCVRPIIRR
jgi:uncharacterized protein (TIGR02145 family)